MALSAQLDWEKISSVLAKPGLPVLMKQMNKELPEGTIFRRDVTGGELQKPQPDHGVICDSMNPRMG